MVERLSRVRTDLAPFTDGEIACLENQGYSLADVAVRKWAENLLPAEVPAFRGPHPEYVDEAAASAAVRDSAERGVIRDHWETMKEYVTD